MEAFPTHRRIRVVKRGELQLADKSHQRTQARRAGGSARIYFFFGLTACFSDAPAENFGAFDALIFTRSPVRGLTPWRAARLTTENLPKPVMITSSPFLSVFETVPKNDSTARAESVFVRPLS